MKKTFTFLFSSLLYISIAAQAPQGINYQAVAYNNLGQPVTNQTVGVRLSILDGGAAGPVLYSETQAPNTDNTGLFSIVIGNGTAVSGTFAGINWASGTKWLKTEIDIAGGNNYVLMGSSQFMSVPYALYANKSGVGSATFTMPDGFDNATTIVIPDSTNYTVPAGKNLYIPSTEPPVSIDGDTLFANLYGGGANAKTFIGAGENSVVWAMRSPIVGFLVDKIVEWKTVNIRNTSFTVPTGKQFVVVNTCNNTGGGTTWGYAVYGGGGFWEECKTTLNNTAAFLTSNMILSPGTTLSTTGCTASSNMKYFIINGYFMNK